MTHHFDPTEQERKHVFSRRGIFKWAGQVVAGTSLAGIGLNIMNPQNALAASKSVRLVEKSTVGKSGTGGPECIPCPNNCQFISCTIDVNYCGPVLEYKTIYNLYQGGCVQAGQQCPYQHVVLCADQCVEC